MCSIATKATMNLSKLRELQKTSERIAKEAGALLLKYAGSSFNAREKAKFDLVTDADIASNKFISDQLRKEWPDSLVLAEEDGVPVEKLLKNAGHAEVLWIVDPLDGTTNFAKHVPHYAVVIAAYNPQTKEILTGCIYDPWRKECFTAIKGQGAKLNGKRIRASGVNDFHFAMAATGFSYSRRKGDDNNLAELAPFAQKCLALRRYGAASLDLAWVACSRYDIYWESWLSPWDVCAGILIVREAGGMVSSFSREPSTPFDNNILATCTPLHQKALKQIRKAREKAGLK